jgi:hypothetical protein
MVNLPYPFESVYRHMVMITLAATSRHSIEPAVAMREASRHGGVLDVAPISNHVGRRSTSCCSSSFRIFVWLPYRVMLRFCP